MGRVVPKKLDPNRVQLKKALEYKGYVYDHAGYFKISGNWRVDFSCEKEDKGYYLQATTVIALLRLISKVRPC